MFLTDILSKLQKAKKLADGSYLTLCPSHSDKVPSLHLSQSEDKILLKCQAGCDTEAVCQALGITLADLFTKTKEGKKTIVATYDYQDESGNLLYQVVRYEPKSFAQRHKNSNDEWVWNTEGVRKVLYHLPEILVEPDTIFLVEGERDADTLWQWGQVATTSPGGSNAWKPEYADFLIGKKVVVIPDNDTPGLAYARAVINSLKGKAREIRCILLPEGIRDITHWIENGHILDELNEQDADTLGVKITQTISGFNFEWVNLLITVKRVDVHRDGRITGELCIESKGQSLLPPTQLNFLASRTRKILADDLQKKYPDWDWAYILDFLTQEVQKRARAGDPGETINVNDDIIKAPEYLLKPLVMEGVPSIIYGDKESLKTTLSLAIIACISLGWVENPLGWSIGHPARVAFLDWESNSNLIRYTILKLRKGMDIPHFNFAYRRCSFNLVDDLEQIQNFIEKNKSSVVVIDSLGAACGGDLMKPEPALKFFEALRQLSVPTAFIIAQNAKGDENKKTIFGSSYFTYYARNIFELKKAESSDPDSVSIGIFHRASNYSARQQPLGYRLDFTNDTISIESEALSIAEFSDKVKQSERVKEYLRDGAKSVSQIADHLGTTLNQTRVVLSRLKKRSILISLERGMWGIKY